MQPNLKQIVRWWVTPKLPIQHVFIKPKDRPKSAHQVARVYLRKWLAHPIKRRLAKYYLYILQKFFGLTVVGITGSAGKTTTKEMLASIMKHVGDTVYSYKNIDPVFNIPTTILKCKPRTKCLILEMGVEFPGEMDYCTWLATPLVGVITNIFPTHTEFFEGIKGVAKEKLKLIENLPSQGFAILNKNDPILRKSVNKTDAKIIWFGSKGDIYAERINYKVSESSNFTLVNSKSKINVQIPIIGKQLVDNSLAASATAISLGVNLQTNKKGSRKYIAYQGIV